MKKPDALTKRFIEAGYSPEEADGMALEAHRYGAEFDQRIAEACHLIDTLRQEHGHEFVIEVVKRWSSEIPRSISDYEWTPNSQLDAAILRYFACMGIELLIDRKFSEQYALEFNADGEGDK